MPCIAMKCKNSIGLDELIKRAKQKKGGDKQTFDCFTDELRVSLYINKSIVELCGGNLNLVFDESS